MPMPPVDPMPLPVNEFFRAAPLEAQDASYFAASARIASLSINCIILNIHTVFLLSRKFTGFASFHPIWPTCSNMVAANQHVLGSADGTQGVHRPMGRDGCRWFEAWQLNITRVNKWPLRQSEKVNSSQSAFDHAVSQASD